VRHSLSHPRKSSENRREMKYCRPDTVLVSAPAGSRRRLPLQELASTSSFSHWTSPPRLGIIRGNRPSDWWGFLLNRALLFFCHRLVCISSGHPRPCQSSVSALVRALTRSGEAPIPSSSRPPSVREPTKVFPRSGKTITPRSN
jgi:hypothetical protein